MPDCRASSILRTLQAAGHVVDVDTGLKDVYKSHSV